MISVAMATLIHSFHITPVQATWLATSYYIASAVVQPLSGKMGDLFGHRRMFLLGLAAVGLASVAAPWSESFPVLLFWRILQAAGSATIFPNGMVMVRLHVHRDQGRAFGILALMTGPERR